MYPVEYEVRVWNECKGQYGEEEIVHGISFAENFTEAANHIETYYGSDLISMKIYLLEETSTPIYEFEYNSNPDFHGMFKIQPVETYDGY